MNILITGMSGLIGAAVRRRLAPRARLSALNRSTVEGVPTTRADLADLEALRPAFDGQETVIHLAAKAGENYSWEELLQTNIVGTRNVLAAAREAGCKRVIFASSGATVAGWELEEPYQALVEGRYGDAPERWRLIRHDEAVRPRGVYGATKVWGEAFCRHVADSSPLSVLCVRIGYVNAEDRPVHPRHFAVWCSQRDIAAAIERCVDAPPGLRFDTLFVNSRNRWGYRDLSHTEAVLGFVPQDAAEDHRGGRVKSGS
ncbi:MAG: NAD(P)-dependent oxidoreductase [Gammaproteobacteria bacterium]|nr:NAD(P)-dependent oxidoreductase [Gammaproteobacteria bacterium]